MTDANEPRFEFTIDGAVTRYREEAVARPDRPFLELVHSAVRQELIATETLVNQDRIERMAEQVVDRVFEQDSIKHLLS